MINITSTQIYKISIFAFQIGKYVLNVNTEHLHAYNEMRLLIHY